MNSKSKNIQNFRGTNYRGITKNFVSSWQIFMQFKGKKHYIATVDNIDYAAILFDLCSLQSKGMQVKTNFNYTKAELLALLLLKDFKQMKADDR